MATFQERYQAQLKKEKQEEDEAKFDFATRVAAQREKEAAEEAPQKPGFLSQALDKAVKVLNYGTLPSQPLRQALVEGLSGKKVESPSLAEMGLMQKHVPSTSEMAEQVGLGNPDINAVKKQGSLLGAAGEAFYQKMKRPVGGFLLDSALDAYTYLPFTRIPSMAYRAGKALPPMIQSILRKASLPAKMLAYPTGSSSSAIGKSLYQAGVVPASKVGVEVGQLNVPERLHDLGFTSPEGIVKKAREIQDQLMEGRKTDLFAPLSEVSIDLEPALDPALKEIRRQKGLRDIRETAFLNKEEKRILDQIEQQQGIPAQFGTPSVPGIPGYTKSETSNTLLDEFGKPYVYETKVPPVPAIPPGPNIPGVPGKKYSIEDTVQLKANANQAIDEQGKVIERASRGDRIAQEEGKGLDAELKKAFSQGIDEEVVRKIDAHLVDAYRQTIRHLDVAILSTPGLLQRARLEQVKSSIQLKYRSEVSRILKEKGLSPGAEKVAELNKINEQYKFLEDIKPGLLTMEKEALENSAKGLTSWTPEILG